MSTLKWLFAPLFVILLSACQTQQTTLPDWVTNPVQENQYLSAVGEGVSLKEAQANAKQALAAQLLSHVSNELTVLSIADGAFHRTYTERLSNSSFNDIPLPDIRNHRATKLDGTYFAEVQLSKATLKSFLETNLSTLIQDNQTRLTTIKTLKNPFEQWWQYETQSSSFNALADQTLIYNSLFTPKNEQAAALLSDLNQAYNQAKNGLVLAINDDTPIPGLTNTLQGQLTQHGIEAKRVRQFSSRPELHAKLKSQTQRLQGDHYADSTLTLVLKSHKGQALSSISLNAKGVSVSSTSEAKQKSYQELIKLLKKEDIIQRLKDA
jgi:hypothetical protein